MGSRVKGQVRGMNGRDPEWMSAARTMLDGTGCRITGHATRTADAERVELEVDCLSDTLRPGVETLVLARGRGGRRWRVTAPDGFIADQRERHSRLRPEDGNRGMMVDVVLARRLRQVANRSTARRALFALSQGAEIRKTEWEDVSHTAVRNGVAFATMALAADTTWRLNELRIKGRNLPETALAAMADRSLRDMVEIPILEGLVVRRARNGSEGLVATCVLETEPYTEVWRDLGGE